MLGSRSYSDQSGGSRLRTLTLVAVGTCTSGAGPFRRSSLRRSEIMVGLGGVEIEHQITIWCSQSVELALLGQHSTLFYLRVP